MRRVQMPSTAHVQYDVRFKQSFVPHVRERFAELRKGGSAGHPREVQKLADVLDAHGARFHNSFGYDEPAERWSGFATVTFPVGKRRTHAAARSAVHSKLQSMNFLESIREAPIFLPAFNMPADELVGNSEQKLRLPN